MFNADSLVSIFEQYRNLAVIMSLLISIGISIVGILPSIFVTGANIIFFGPLYGFIISLMGETIGAAITFKLYRAGFKKKAELVKSKHEILNKLVNSSGRRTIMLILEGRLIPFVPSGFVTLAASLSNVNTAGFTIATFVGKIPSILIEAFVSYDVINIKENYIRLTFTVIGLILLMLTIRWKEE